MTFVDELVRRYVDALFDDMRHGQVWSPETHIRAAIVEALKKAEEAVEDTDVVEAKGDTYYAQLGDGHATVRACAAAVRALYAGDGT